MAEHLMLAAARTLRAVAALLSISLRSVPEYNEWEPNRDVLDVKENKVDDTVVSKFDYLVNGLNQRRSVDTSGTAFPAAPSWVWDYDSLGQVVSADHSVNANDRAYQYDTIGNRKKSADSLNLPGDDNYAANSRNQYSVIPLAPAAPAYDFDGNMTSGPLPVAPTANSSLAWDAENRMTSTTVGTTTTTSKYDAQARRIAKTVGGSTTLFVYDGFNCIAEYTMEGAGAPAIAATRLWGIDLSGTLQGAGGVGGLLAETHGENTFYPTFDGNGNVTEYLNADGSVAAHFEYDPFGNTVANTDSNNLFHYRFSTKYLDFETGLYYYNYRYYDPLTGRWPSRDPIGENGGLNLYGFVINSPVMLADILGLSTTGSYACECDRQEVNKKIKEMSEKAGKMSGDDLKNVPAKFRNNGISKGREFGGRICCNKKTKAVTTTGPVVSQSGDHGWIKDPDYWKGQAIDVDAVAPQCPNGTEDVAWYHSHPSGSDRFSNDDRGNTRYPLGAGTPEGKTSLLEPVGGTVDNPYGSGYKSDKEVNGWGINDDGTLYPKNVVPDNSGNYTSNFKNY